MLCSISACVRSGLSAALILFAGFFSVAAAHNDGSPDTVAPATVGNAINVFTCASVIKNQVKTFDNFVHTSSTTFQQLPGAQVVVSTPANVCIKVLFTAETSCSGPSTADYCYVQAMLDGRVLDPNGAGFQALDSEDGTASGHSFEWIGYAAVAGNHTISLQARTYKATTYFELDDFTIDVQVLGR